MTRQAGYSLFEVLVAFAILAMVLAVLLPGKAALMARVGGGEHRVLAQDYALSRLARLRVEGPLPPGPLTETYRGWRIEITVIREPLPGSTTGQSRTEATLTIKEQGGGPPLAVVTGYLVPAQVIP